MADASSVFAIRAISVDSASWTPVIAPIACNTWSIRPDAAVKIRTDPNDATTEDTIQQGLQDVLLTHPISGTKFPQGTIFAHLQAVTGSTVVRVQFAV
jgi:hypothetical protein